MQKWLKTTSAAVGITAIAVTPVFAQNLQPTPKKAVVTSVVQKKPATQPVAASSAAKKTAPAPQKPPSYIVVNKGMYVTLRQALTMMNFKEISYNQQKQAVIAFNYAVDRTHPIYFEHVVGTDSFIINQFVHKLSNKTITQQGTTYVPFDFYETIQKVLKSAAEAAEKVNPEQHEEDEEHHHHEADKEAVVKPEVEEPVQLSKENQPGSANQEPEMVTTSSLDK